MPHVFVSDAAFRLSKRMLKPFGQTLNLEKRTFNYRLSRARRVAENAFGILCSRFRIFEKNISLSVEKVEIITLAACALHNFLRTEGNVPNIESLDDVSTLIHLERSSECITTNIGIKTRSKFCHYFNHIDLLPWQQDSVNKFNY